MNSKSSNLTVDEALVKPRPYAPLDTEPATGGRTTAKKIMTVDDSASVRMLVSTALKHAGYDVIEASDGREALDKLGKEHVNLLLTDVNMPYIDGIELTRKVRQGGINKYIPIVMITTEFSAFKKLDGVSAGATGWIVKPFKSEELIALVKKILK